MKELTVLVGPPGSGKSTLAKNLIKSLSKSVCMERCLKRENHPTIKNEQDAGKALDLFFRKYERPTPDEADEIEFRYPKGPKPEAIICDLDGTLCNIDHRLHFVKKEEIKPRGFETPIKKPDWGSFFKEMTNDTVNEWCEQILMNFSDPEAFFNKDIILCSGRPDSYRAQTLEWLYTKTSGVNFDELFMRSRNDFRKDDIVKEQILDFEILTRYKPVFAIDDRKQVVDMWRRRGIVCLACAEGDF